MIKIIVYYLLIFLSVFLLPFSKLWRSKNVILNFHRVTDFSSGYRYSFSVDKFRNLIAYIGRRFPIAEFPEKGVKPVEGVILTFDDGYEDLYLNVLPIMRAADVPFYVFVITSMIEGDTYKWLPNVHHLNKRQIEALTQGGGVIGIHCHTHVDYTLLSSVVLKNEVVQAIDALVQARIPYKREVVCLPYGQGFIC